MLAGKHIFAVFLDRNMTLAMREKKILCQHLELYKRWMKFIFLATDWFSLYIHIVVNMTLVADRNLGRVMEMLTMKGKKQDDKEKGGGGKRERENGHMKQL